MQTVSVNVECIIDCLPSHPWPLSNWVCLKSGIIGTTVTKRTNLKKTVVYYMQMYLHKQGIKLENINFPLLV